MKVGLKVDGPKADGLGKARYLAHRSMVRECLDLDLGIVEVATIVSVGFFAVVVVMSKAVISLGENDG